MFLALIVATLLAFIPAFLFASFIYWLDRYEKEPKILLFGTFFWGGFIAIIGGIIGSLILDVGFSSVFESDIANQASYSITAPVVEEFWKGLAVLIVFLLFRKEFDSVLDGLVYGAIAGLGFAATENVLYFMGQFSEAGWAGMFTNFALRVGVFAWGHPSYTAFIGIGFALARMNRNILVKLIAPPIGYMFAVFAHSFHNTGATLASSGESVILLILMEWLGWFVMFGFVVWMVAHERTLLKKYLLEEVTNGSMSHAQFNSAVSFFQFGARFAALGSGSLRATSRFYQVCGELAHKKNQLAKFGDEKGNQEIINKLRAELKLLAPQAKA